MTEDLRGDKIIDSRDVAKRIEDVKDLVRDQISEVHSAANAERMDRLDTLRERISPAFYVYRELHPAEAGDFDEWLAKIAEVDDHQLSADAKEYFFLQALLQNNDEPEPDLDDVEVVKALQGIDSDQEELVALLELQEQGENYAGDWSFGATLIREDAFAEYAQELAEDIGAVNKDSTWPNNHIDWEAAAEALKQDYTTITFDGEDYLVRS